ncbi:MAG TPA: NB-ARC domain-containing protein, partial [Herpetosiphonaceae bacterium]|nr:NB-ARC domain-containing protein [Herpetosiphonaceae bacterium]
NLPIPATPLIGRAHEVAAVATALVGGDIRLLTLIGPPGIGKTRISLQAAVELVEDTACEVCFVALAPLSLPALVAPTIAQALGVKEAAGPSIVESLKRYLRPRQLLLLLDNFEQVVAGAPVVAELLAACPRLKVLVTSRVPLHLSGEHEYAVPPLQVPELDMAAAWPALERLEAYEAVRLFVARARAVNRDFALTETNARAVAEICWRLDGLPLAIELAAARIKVFDPRSLLEQLAGRSGRSSLDMLAGGARDLPARQQTVRGAIAWSFHLLDPAQQQLFARLSVFVGGCTLEAAAAVCPERGDADQAAPREPSIVEGIASLVDNSLLERSASPVDDQDSEPRFRMLELIREYAREHLVEHGDAESTSRRHALHYLHLAEQAEPELAKARQQVWLRRLMADYGNIRSALGRLIAWEEHGLAARLSAALWQFWEVRGMLSEGREWLEKVLRTGALTPAVRAETLNAAGQLARHQGDVARAATLFEENLLLRQELGDRRRIAYALNDLAIIRMMQGDPRAGIIHLKEGLALFRAEQDTAGIADSLLNLSGARLFQGDREQATACLAESLALFREFGNLRGIAAAQGGLGFLILAGRDVRQAASLFDASLALNRQIGDRLLSLYSVNGLAITAARQARLARAARLFGGAEAWREALGFAPFPTFYFDVEAEMQQVRDRMDEVAWHEAWTAGAAMPPERLVAYALEGDGDED